MGYVLSRNIPFKKKGYSFTDRHLSAKKRILHREIIEKYDAQGHFIGGMMIRHYDQTRFTNQYKLTYDEEGKLRVKESLVIAGKDTTVGGKVEYYYYPNATTEKTFSKQGNLNELITRYFLNSLLREEYHYIATFDFDNPDERQGYFEHTSYQYDDTNRLVKSVRKDTQGQEYVESIQYSGEWKVTRSEVKSNSTFLHSLDSTLLSKDQLPLKQIYYFPPDTVKPSLITTYTYNNKRQLILQYDLMGGLGDSTVYVYKNYQKYGR